MQRILVMGPSGAGKSTLARQLGERLGLPVLHLDALHFQPGWAETDPAEETAALATFVQQDAWVIDGNYLRLLDLRLPRADTVIFLDFPRRVCYWRVLGRWARYAGRTRPDMAPECPEKVDLEFLRWIWGYPNRTRPRVLTCLEQVRGEKQVVVLRSANDLRTFLDSLVSTPSLVNTST